MIPPGFHNEKVASNTALLELLDCLQKTYPDPRYESLRKQIEGGLTFAEREDITAIMGEWGRRALAGIERSK